MQSPEKTIFILVSKDGDYINLLKELKRIGVDVYIWSETDEISDRLKASVEDSNLIPWDKPYVVDQCIDVIKELKGKPVKRHIRAEMPRTVGRKRDLSPRCRI